MADVFLTYAPADGAFVLRIARALERAGLTAARAPQTPSPDWPLRLYGEIDQASAILALWSSESVACEWTMMEAAIGLHFGQLASLRIDAGLDRNKIPAEFREPQTGEVMDLSEADVAPSGWNNEAEQNLDRRLAPLVGRIRQLKARGPYAQAGAAAPGMPEGDGVARLLRPGFTWPRHDGTEKKSARSLPALAATRREAAFRTAFTSLGAMEYPADIRTGLIELGDLNTARRGMARLYAEGLQRNDREFWALIARIAAPLSPSLCLASLLRAGATPDEVEGHVDPRDAREIHAQRVGRRRMGRPTVVLWPIAAVAAGLAAVLLAPTIGEQVSRFSSIESSPKTEAASASIGEGPAIETAAVAPAKGPQPRLYDPKEFAAPPWAGGRTQTAPPPLDPPKGSATPIQEVSVTPNAGSTSALQTPAPPLPVQAPNLEWSIDPGLATPAERQIVRLCRAQPGPAEIGVEVMPDERMIDVAGRVFMDDPANLRRLIARNATCLDARKLTLSDGREIGGADLIFPGDRLIVPMITSDVL